ncbi:MAG: MBL fold metallo-hydrolase [Acidobacteriota bacterium]
MPRAFASADLTESKPIRLQKLSGSSRSWGAYAYLEKGDPTSGIILGDDGVMVIDARATPVSAQDVVERVRTITDQPIRYVLLTHYHAVRVLGASAFEGAEILASTATRDLIVERGKQDWKSEAQRFPRLFRGLDSIPGLTWPTITFEKSLTVHLGKLEVQLLHLGAGHTAGDTVAWLPKQKTLFAGDLVENGATPYSGDAHLGAWPRTLQRLRALGPKKLVPGRGPAATTPAAVEKAISGTEAYVRALLSSAKRGRKRSETLKETYDRTARYLQKDFGHWEIFDHCLPFNVSRAYDEAQGISHPQIWTAKRDLAMWRALEAS